MTIGELIADDGQGNIVAKSPTHSVPVTIRMTNIDDVFLWLRNNGVKEVEASFEEMFMCASFVLANTNSLKLHEEYSKIFSEGKIGRFFGVALIPLDAKDNQNPR